MGYITVKHDVPDGQKAQWKAEFNHNDSVRKGHGVSGSAITAEGPNTIEVTHKITDDHLAEAHQKAFSAKRKTMGAKK